MIGDARVAGAIVQLGLFAALGTSSPLPAQLADVGLSAVRAQSFDRASLPNANALGGDTLGSAFATGDFNGDGADDLATGAPANDGPVGSPLDECGEVVVRYGVPGKGISASAAPAVLGQFVAGSANPAEAFDRFGYALAACDLNGDGYDDLAVGVPWESITISAFEFEHAGLVEIYYGTSAGLVPPASQRLWELKVTALNLPSAEAHFGFALACGDFNDDTFDDLAVGVPFRDLPDGPVDAGRVNVFPGSASGVGPDAYGLDQNSAAIEEVAEADDFFAEALAAGDFNGDGFDDLAAGVPGETNTSNVKTGGVHVLLGGLGGLAAGLDSLYFQGAPVGTVAGDAFGSELAAGNFDADDFDDLAVGVFLKDVVATDQGVVFEVFGSPSGLAPARTQAFSQDSILGEGASAIDERFGEALAVGDFDGDGADDLAAGAPGESVDLDLQGAVVIVRGSLGAGLEPLPNQRRQINPGLGGFPGDPDEAFLFWGREAASGDFDGNGHADLVVGAPMDDDGGLPSVGSVVVLYGALFADGFDSVGLDFWSAAAP